MDVTVIMACVLGLIALTLLVGGIISQARENTTLRNRAEVMRTRYNNEVAYNAKLSDTQQHHLRKIADYQQCIGEARRDAKRAEDLRIEACESWRLDTQAVMDDLYVACAKVDILEAELHATYYDQNILTQAYDQLARSKLLQATSLQDRLEMVKSQLADVYTVMGNERARTATLIQKVSEVSGERDSVMASFSEQRLTVAALQNDVTDLTTEIECLSGQIKVLEADLATARIAYNGKPVKPKVTKKKANA